MTNSELKSFLDEKHDLYNRPNFIETDPIQIPHSYNLQEDIEISAFLSATIAWGKRSMIIRNAKNLMTLMGNSPYDFVMNADEKNIAALKSFKHRTFQGDDCVFFIHSLRNIYSKFGSLKNVFEALFLKDGSIKTTLEQFREQFFEIPHLQRTCKHVSDVSKNSAAKRLNLFLMWMVRSDNRGVHFGLFEAIPSSALYIPLDVHSGNVGRKLGLLKRTQNDWKAVTEFTNSLKTFDSNDPVKYDFALFGLGVFEKF